MAESTHYQDAEMLIALADHSALAATAAAETDPMASLPGMVGAVVYLLGAQVHATLALADAIGEEVGDGPA